MASSKLDPVPGSNPYSLILSEIIRWICIIIPLALSAWRFADLMEESIDGRFWGIVCGSLIAFSLLIYLPLKIVAIRYRLKHNLLKDYRWRPAILTYIIVATLPSFGMILAAVEMKIDRQSDNCTLTESYDPCTLDAATATVLQVIVLGMVGTEWMSKIREEYLSLDLITAMSYDFFFAYDCIHFITLPAYEEVVYQSDWVFVCFVFTFLAQFRYIPFQPINIEDRGSSIGTAIFIVVSILTLEIPFLIFRLWVMIAYVMHSSELVYMLKNIGMICFGCTQLYFIYKARLVNNKVRNQKQDGIDGESVDDEEDLRMLALARRPKCSGVWDLDRANECIKVIDGKEVNVCECKEMT